MAIFAPRLIGAPRTVLALDDEGFVDSASPMAAGRVAWSEVTELTTVRMYGESNIAVRVRDGDALSARRNALARVLARPNRRWGDVWIPGATIDARADEVVDAMTARWENAVRRSERAPLTE